MGRREEGTKSLDYSQIPGCDLRHRGTTTAFRKTRLSVMQPNPENSTVATIQNQNAFSPSMLYHDESPRCLVPSRHILGSVSRIR